MSHFAFRTNLLGQLVLQVRIKTREWCPHAVRFIDGHAWRDAKATDLAAYYALTKEAS